MSKQTVFDVFNKLKRHIERSSGRKLVVSLIVDYERPYPKPRDYAQTDGSVIFVSPKMLSAEEHRVEGLLRHEFAHVVFIQSGNWNHSEREADMLAEELFGAKILYDSDDIQSISEGRAPRPNYLPN